MGKKTRSYTADYKNEAVKLALDTVSIGVVAKDLGIPVSTLHNWVTKYSFGETNVQSFVCEQEQLLRLVKESSQ